MPHLKLTYFNIAGRAETARMALFIGNIEFEDHRIAFDEWPALKPKMPFLAIPVLEVDGTVLSQANSINRYVGKLSNLYPEDAFQAALCDEIMDAVEDVSSKIFATFGMSDEAEKKTTREAIANGPIAHYLQKFEQYLSARGGDYFADNRLTIADLRMMVWTDNIYKGTVDYIPTDLVDKNAPKLAAQLMKIKALPQIVAYKLSQEK